MPQLIRVVAKLRKKSIPLQNDTQERAATGEPETARRSDRSPRPSQVTLEELWRMEREARRSQSGGLSIDPDTGERAYDTISQTSTLVADRPMDTTDMIHSLMEHGAVDSITGVFESALRVGDSGFVPEYINPELVARRESMIDSLPEDLWKRIAYFLTPADAACLVLANRTLSSKLELEPLLALKRPENKQERIKFLNHMDAHLPLHLLCFPCGKYHFREQPGNEKWKSDFINNPIFRCPNTRDSILPRTRIAHGRQLPFAYVQLALRARKHTSAHGINHNTLGRRWRCRDGDWSHQIRFHIHKGHLLMRVISQCITAPKLTETGERLVLYTREEYEPYFSVCAHWKDGDLMKMCKCAMSHIPEPQRSFRTQVLKDGKGVTGVNYALRRPSFIVRGCGECQPMRRCPQCPTEYLVEVKMVEDPSDPITNFKHALQVTRWSDLGDGSSPEGSSEWRAIHSKDSDYDSLGSVGARAISGIFESEVSGAIPGQRILNLNPKGTKKGELGNEWY
jgi:hypothetical protein